MNNIMIEIEFDKLTGRYSATIYDFPIIYGEGDTRDEALDNLINAVLIW